MSKPILLKHSEVSGKVPLATDLQYREVALNTHDAILYTKRQSDNKVVALAAAPGEWVDMRPYLVAPFDWDASRDGKNAHPQARIVGDTVEFRGVVRANVTNAQFPAGVLFQNLPVEFRPFYTTAGVGFFDASSPLWFGSFGWIVGGSVAYGGANPGEVKIVAYNPPATITDGALVLDQMSWKKN